MAGNSTESGRSVTSKITSILLTFTEGSEHSLTEIARLAGLPISTAHRLTSELASWRLLERTDDGHYRAGLPLRMIGTVDACPPSIAERAPCVLEDLSAATKSRARLGVLQELDVAYIEKQPGPRPATAFTPAATLPAHPTALGRALLAFSPARTVEMTIMRGLRPYTTPHHHLTRPVPPRPGRHPAHPRRRHPLGTRSRRLRRRHARLRTRRRRRRRHRTRRPRTRPRTPARHGRPRHRLPQPVPRARRRRRPYRRMAPRTARRAPVAVALTRPDPGTLRRINSRAVVRRPGGLRRHRLGLNRQRVSP